TTVATLNNQISAACGLTGTGTGTGTGTTTGTGSTGTGTASSAFPIGTWVAPGGYSFTVTAPIESTANGDKWYSGSVTAPGSSVAITSHSTTTNIYASIDYIPGAKLFAIQSDNFEFTPMNITTTSMTGPLLLNGSTNIPSVFTATFTKQ